jgi:transposase
VTRLAYPSDISDAEWEFTKGYLEIISFDAPQRKHDPREILNALRWICKTGAPWRYLPHDLPEPEIVRQQAQRWFEHQCFENMVDDLRETIRVAVGKNPYPTVSLLDSRTVQSTPESGHRSGYNGHKCRNGSKVHLSTDTLGLPITLEITPANKDDRSQIATIAERVQLKTGDHVEVLMADQGYNGEEAMNEAEFWGMTLELTKVPKVKNEFVPVPKRWAVERTYAWTTRFRRLVRDYERLKDVFAGMHYVAFAVLLGTKCIPGVS